MTDTDKDVPGQDEQDPDADDAQRRHSEEPAEGGDDEGVSVPREHAEDPAEG